MVTRLTRFTVHTRTDGWHDPTPLAGHTAGQTVGLTVAPAKVRVFAGGAESEKPTSR